jgi:hypothetical protein
MANPNIINVSDIRGNTAVMNVTTVSTALVTNSTGSNSVYKIVLLSATNISDTDTVAVSVNLERSSIPYSLGRNINIPLNSSLAIVTKDAALYLIEGDVIKCSATANSNAQIICSYEVIS